MKFQELFDNAQQLTVIARSMKLEGMPVDQARREAHRERLCKERDQAEAAFRAHTGYQDELGRDESLLDSHKQLCAIFFSDKGYGVRASKVSEKTGLPCLDKGILRELLQSDRTEVRRAAELLLLYRQANTTESRYIGRGYAGELGSYGLPVLRASGRHHPTFGVCAAETQRFTCQGGAQQIQKDTLAEVKQPDGSFKVVTTRPGTRDIFRAPHGWVWMEADYSALELREFALYAGVRSWLDSFQAGKDVHKLNTAIALKKDYAAVLKQERDVIKTATFGGIAYGGDASTVHAQVVNKYPRLSVLMVEEFKRNILNAMPEIPEYHVRAVQEAMRDGFTPLATGDRIRWKYPERDGSLFGEVKPTELINKRMQRTAARVINEAMPKVAARLDPAKQRLILQLHDALHLLVRDDSVQQTAKMLSEQMFRVLHWEGRSIDLVVEVKAGPSWGEQQEIK